MIPVENKQLPHRADGLDTILRLLRVFGLIGFLGGLAALSAMWAFGPTPHTFDQWQMTIGQIKAIFFPCAFSGIVILIVVGLTSWRRHRRVLNQARWFRLTIAMLTVAIPASHIWARLTAEKLYETVEAGHLEEAAMLWDQLGAAYIVSFFVMSMIATIVIVKPRLGQD